MSVNKYRPHLFVLPEDEANRKIANGFESNLKVKGSAIQILNEARGWEDVIELFENEHIQELRKYSYRMLVLVIDFDNFNIQNRLNYIRDRIPEDLQSRVFILGVRSNPEQLRRLTGKTYEEIGETLAENCANNTIDLWEHPLLDHNRPELERMIRSVKPFLFSIDP